jgi:hypothetical protein
MTEATVSTIMSPSELTDCRLAVVAGKTETRAPLEVAPSGGPRQRRNDPI